MNLNLWAIISIDQAWGAEGWPSTMDGKGASVDTSDIEKYADVMEEIKRRMEVIDLFLSGRREARFVAATVETVGLQFRKVFELIAFASLAANRGRYSYVYSDFAKHWEASRLFRNLRRINPGFFPKPVIEVAAPERKIIPKQFTH